MRSTWSHVSARSSSVRAPVSRDTTTYAYSLLLSAALSTAFAWSRVSDLDGRPSIPRGTPQSATTLRLTLSRAIARVTDRLRHAYRSSRVRVLRLLAFTESHLSISAAL